MLEAIAPKLVMLSGAGIATIGVTDSMTHTLESGTVQAVLAVFIVILLTGLVYLFNLLMKTIKRGHEERDVREAKFVELLIEVKGVLTSTNAAMKETTQASAITREAMHEVVKEMRTCHDLRIKDDAQKEG